MAAVRRLLSAKTSAEVAQVQVRRESEKRARARTLAASERVNLKQVSLNQGQRSHSGR